MLKIEELRQIAKERLEEADILWRNKKFDGAVYLCGYAVELGLEARICKTLGWSDFPDTKEYQSFKTHDLDTLLHLSGIERTVKTEKTEEWSTVASWDSNMRYRPVGSANEKQARDMISCARELLGRLEIL